jgi:hypothetical protein
MKGQEYIREDGSNPYQKWFDSLDTRQFIESLDMLFILTPES